MPARIAVSRLLPGRSSRWASGAALLALGLGGLTACGGSSSGSTANTTTPAATSSSAAASSSGGSAQAQALTATEKDFSIALDKTSLPAGSYTITVVNRGSATHDLAVEEEGKTKAKSDSVGPGQSTTLTIDLDAGEKYVFFCSIGNHRAMGMELDVTVS